MSYHTIIQSCMIKFLANLIGVHELVVQLVILPYTYLPQSKELMADVRSYVSDYRIIENVYAVDYNDNILMTDLVNFCVNKDFSLEQRRMLGHLSAVDIYLQTGYFPSNVTNMSFMFRQAAVFNQDIGSWNVSNLTNIESMFARDAAFNQPTGSWNVDTNMDNDQRRARLILGLLTREQRTQFINEYILHSV